MKLPQGYPRGLRHLPLSNLLSSFLGSYSPSGRESTVANSLA